MSKKPITFDDIDDWFFETMREKGEDYFRSLREQLSAEEFGEFVRIQIEQKRGEGGPS